MLEGPFPSEVVGAARAWIGTPYHDQMAVRGHGCDCLGLVARVWRAVYGNLPEPLPAYSGDWGDADGNEHILEAARRHFDEIDVHHAGPGDLLAFRWRRHGVAKHCGILTQGSVFAGRMVHAYEKRGVVEVSLGAWGDRVVAAFAWRPRHRVSIPGHLE